MKTSDFYYDLPQELIAQTPLERRDSSRLMVLHRETGELEHRHFYDIVDYLQPGDCLVMNDSRVLPARLLGHRRPAGRTALHQGAAAARGRTAGDVRLPRGLPSDDDTGRRAGVSAKNPA